MAIRKESWKFILPFLVCGHSLAIGETTIVPPENYSWGPNIGWLDWAWDPSEGVSISQTLASGFIYSPNVGWICLGDGSPVSGHAYSNASAEDYGVNMDPTSDQDFYFLSGYAYGANIGWISFDVKDQAGEEFQPRVEKSSGILRGYAWSANVGWLPFESPTAQLRTDLVNDIWKFF